jgi:hypothetical protein
VHVESPNDPGFPPIRKDSGRGAILRHRFGLPVIGRANANRTEGSARGVRCRHPTNIAGGLFPGAHSGTLDWSEISGKIARAKPSGLTALLDAIHLATTQMKHARNARKALVVLSDGGDHFSRRNLRQLTATLIESDAQVYAMGVFDRDYSVKHTREERNGPKLLDQLDLYTGGATFPLSAWTTCRTSASRSPAIRQCEAGAEPRHLQSTHQLVSERQPVREGRCWLSTIEIHSLVIQFKPWL